MLDTCWIVSFLTRQVNPPSIPSPFRRPEESAPAICYPCFGLGVLWARLKNSTFFQAKRRDSMIVLNNREVQQLLTMDMCLAALEEAYGQYSRGEAVLVHRNDMLIESEGDYSKGLLYPDDNDPLQHASPMFRHARRGIEGPYYFSLKTMPAAVKRGGPFNFGCAGLRVKIDIL